MKTLALLHSLDTRFLLWSSGHRDRFRIAYPARWLSRSGDGYIQAAVPCGAWLQGSDDARLLAIRFAWAFAIERVLYFVLKNGLKRRRPPECVPDFQSLIIPSDKFSFPSGHTSAAFLLASLIFDIAPLLGVGLFIWASGVGLSRVILGVHFPSDIAAGAVLGLSVAATVPFLPYTTLVM
ncbi:MAG: phosphatase PAP2 family protein [Granulosicoccus sp.]|nr:phosphatase PAP2 family protein [Granulosicoccus sp.]